MIDNRGGGGGVPAAIATKQAAPDGYTLFLTNNGLFAITAGADRRHPLRSDQGFPADHAAVLVSERAGGAGRSPAKNVKELVALAKTKPGGLNFASQGVGSGGHILGEMFRLKSGAPFVHVPYRGAGPAVTDLVAGNVDLLFSSYVSAIGQVQAGKLRVRSAGPATKRSPAAAGRADHGRSRLSRRSSSKSGRASWRRSERRPRSCSKLNDEFVKAATSPEIVRKVAAQADRDDPTSLAGRDFAQADRLRHRRARQGGSATPGSRRNNQCDGRSKNKRARGEQQARDVSRSGDAPHWPDCVQRCAPPPPTPSVAMSTFTPGPMVEEIETRLM